LDTKGNYFVVNATYLKIYEEARWELITKNNYGLRQVQEIKQGPVIMEVNLKFIKELKLRETITVKTEMVDYPGKIGHLKQQMIKANGEIASEAIFTFGLFDLIARKLIEPTDAWKNAIGWKK
jgi:YbgC/YbaW family acyl-CoA thioester hydrolase